MKEYVIVVDKRTGNEIQRKPVDDKFSSSLKSMSSDPNILIYTGKAWPPPGMKWDSNKKEAVEDETARKSKYLVVDSNKNFKIEEAYVESELEGILAKIYDLSGLVITDPELVDVKLTYYSGELISGSPVYRSGVAVSGEMIERSYTDDVVIVDSEFTGVGVTGPASMLVDYNYEKCAIEIEKQLLTGKSKLITESEDIRKAKVNTGVISYSGELYVTSEEMMGNITGLIMMSQNGIVFPGGPKITTITGERISHNEESLKVMGSLIAMHNENIYASGAYHLKQINSINSLEDIVLYNINDNWP